VNNIFQKTSAYWAKYSEYEYRQGEGGILYIMPAPTAKPSVYDPLKDAETMVVDAINVGRLAMRDGGEYIPKQEILDFVAKYGLLGFMTALSTTPDFVDYDAVYLPKNQYIRDETMTTQDYVALYFPFDKPDFSKNEREARWNIQGNAQADKEILALALTFNNEPMAMNMTLQRDYAERVDWIAIQLRDLAFSLVSSTLYYEDYDRVDENTRDIYRQGVMAFGNLVPTYHISLYRDKPTIVWDFHSLLRGIQMMFSFALTDEARPLRLCKHCRFAFIAENLKDIYCKPECKKKGKRK